MDAEQLTEAVRKHAKTVLLPSVAQAIVDEMGAQESQPLFILHTGAFFGNEQDEWEVEAISQERVDDYCRERSSQHDPLYTIPPDAARRISELETELAEARKEAARLKARSIAYEDAYRVAYLATYQSHNGHWDATMQGGRGCPECIRAREARENCDAILREGLEHLVTIAGSAK